MSGKWPGGFIKKTAPTVVGPVNGEGGSASGIWTLDQVADYESQGLWPKPVTPKELYAWGQNNRGQLGLGDVTQRNSPVQVGALTTWGIQISGGHRHSLAVTGDGKLYAWGYNYYGQLGTNNTTSYSSPVQVGALTDWLQASAGRYQSLAVKTDGTLWSWGRNNEGQLGLGDVTQRNSPVQVGALTTWAQVNSSQATGAVKTDGTLWTWGSGNSGRTGHGNTTDYSSPVQVGALTNWALVRGGWKYMHGITTDGKLYAWGYNSNGQLGTNNTTTYSSPIQVGNLTNWSKVAPASPAIGYNTLATTTDGKLYAWGWNSQGQLGDGTTTQRNSPVQVGALTTWDEVFAGSNSTANTSSGATKTDGTLWTWGYNTNGQLGHNNTTSYSSPVQVGTLTTWIAASMGDAYTLAVKTS